MAEVQKRELNDAYIESMSTQICCRTDQRQLGLGPAAEP